MLPLLLVNLLVIAAPAGLSVWYSFTDWSGIGEWHFIGLDNYTRLLGDEEFITALEHNLAWTVFFLIVPMTMALLGAFLLSRIRRFQMLLRLAYFLPYVVATVVSGSDLVQSPRSRPGHHGPGGKVHLSFLEDVNFLGDPDLALGAVAFVNNWQWWGFLVVIYLAAMQAVEPSLYEAAKLDGANPWQEFRHITLPAIRPTLVFLMLMTVIWSFLIFDYIYIMTQGWPGWVHRRARDAALPQCLREPGSWVCGLDRRRAGTHQRRLRLHLPVLETQGLGACEHLAAVRLAGNRRGRLAPLAQAATPDTRPIYLVLIGLALFSSAALLVFAFNSLKTQSELASSPLGLPDDPEWHNYVQAWNQANLAAGLWNSAIHRREHRGGRLPDLRLCRLRDGAAGPARPRLGDPLPTC